MEAAQSESNLPTIRRVARRVELPLQPILCGAAIKRRSIYLDRTFTGFEVQFDKIVVDHVGKAGAVRRHIKVEYRALFGGERDDRRAIHLKACDLFCLPVDEEERGRQKRRRTGRGWLVGGILCLRG